MSFAEEMKRARLAKSMTQAELAEKCGLSERSIQRIESGKVVASNHSKRLIRRALDMPEAVAAMVEDPRYLAIIHLSTIFNMILPTLILWMLWRNKYHGVDEHARASIDFQLNMSVIMIIAGALSFLIVPILIVIGAGIYIFFASIKNVLRAMAQQGPQYRTWFRVLAD